MPLRQFLVAPGGTLACLRHERQVVVAETFHGKGYTTGTLGYRRSTVYEGELHPDPVELDDCRYWEIVEIRQNIGQGVFTPNFEMEFSKLEEMGIVK